MRHIIVVDDMYLKRKHICDAIMEIYPGARVYEGECGKAVHYHMKSLIEMGIDLKDILLITDMRMPYLEGEKIKLACGVQVLSRMAALHWEVPAIIVSADYVDNNIIKERYPKYLGSILYKEYIDPVDSLRAILRDSSLI